MPHTFPVSNAEYTLPQPELSPARIYPQQIQRAADLIEVIRTQGIPSDRALQHAFRAERKLGKRDRLQLQTLVFFALRHWRLLDRLLNTPQSPALAQLGMALLLANRLDERLAELTGVSIQPSELIERCSQLTMADQLNLTDADMQRLDAAFGPQVDGVGHALLGRAPLDLRVNPLKTTRDLVRDELQALGIEAIPINGLPQGLRIEGSPALTGLASYQQGDFEIQDAGSQWITVACQAQPGHTILDLCAGAGGKALALAVDVGPTGRVLACDVAAERLERLPERSQRAGLTQIECQPITTSADPTLQNRGPFDRVLIDAPCSGSGTFRRHPELRQASIDLPTLCQLQSQLLDDSAPLTRPGGLLIYATCSLWREENEDQIEHFLARHPTWRRHPLPTEIADQVAHQEGMARLRPDVHGSDGFFFAVLRAPAGE